MRLLVTVLLLATLAPAARADEFSRPRPVVILNYTGTAMEPFISKDGQHLFFNNSNAPGSFTDIYFARRMTDGVFLFLGRLPGVNAPPPALDGVPSMDAFGVFYFISTRSYDTTLQTLHAGIFDGSAVSGVTLVPGDVARGEAGWLTMDAEISADGQSLYFADAFFSGGSIPALSDLALATRQGEGNFVRAPDSATMLQGVNTSDLEYAPSISGDGLELFFTRYSFATTKTAILRARRGSTAEPFGTPEALTSIKGFVEAPSLSADGRTLFFHKKVGGKYSIFRATR